MNKVPKNITNKKVIIRYLIRIICYLNLLYLAPVAIISLASIFFYQDFARSWGEPFDAILLLNPWIVRMIMIGGFLIYGLPSFGCILMIRMRKKGYWIFAVPSFVIITASLFVVMTPLNIIQICLLVVSVIALSSLTRHMSRPGKVEY